MDVYAKGENASAHLASNRFSIDTPGRCPSPPASPLMVQLMEMGFSKKAVEIALKATNEVSETTGNVEELIAWLLEYSEECQQLTDCLASLENNDRDFIIPGTSKALLTKVS